MSWDPNLYLCYDRHRLRPAVDLLQQIDLPEDLTGDIYDLGCGAGNVCPLLQARWPNARLIGVDNSKEMLQKAKAQSLPGVEFRCQSISDWRAERPATLLYSNAALHWLPDHSQLLSDLVDQLAPSGVLAVQMPQSWGCSSHRAMREVLDDLDMGSPELRQGLSSSTVAEPELYHKLLRSMGTEVEVWSTTYYQRLVASSDEHPVLTWVRSTGLRPILEDLDQEKLATFLDRYRNTLEVEYPRSDDGSVVFPFPRLFIVAQR